MLVLIRLSLHTFFHGDIQTTNDRRRSQEVPGNMRRTRNGVAAAMMMVTAMATVTLLRINQTSRDVHGYKTTQAFIPNLPNQTRIGRPADIPRLFLIEEADACYRKGPGVEVVVYVHSTIGRVEERQQTRLTWGNSTALKMVVVFMVGRAKDHKEREIVRRESDLYHDIVQGDYGDDYHLLSYKALSSLYWITRNCAHVPWTLHADDDILVDTFMLRKLMQDLKGTPEKDTLNCRVSWHASVLRKGKWKVTKEEINERKYPPYCLGVIWFISTRQVFRLLNASTSVNFLWVDDAYITGYLAKEAKIGFSNIKEYIDGPVSNVSHIGKKLAWFTVKKDRARLWPLLLRHHNATDGKSPDNG